MPVADHQANSPAQLVMRGAGLLLAMLVLLNLNTATAGVVHQLLLPCLLALAVWLVLRSILAIALAGMLLAGVHSEPNALNWITAIAYPLICLSCAAVVTGICVTRFRQKILRTRASRWQSKKPGAETTQQS